MAVHSGVSGLAFELNPESYAFLEQNVEANGVDPLIDTQLGDCIDAPEGVADRVIMGYLTDTEMYLEKAMRVISPNGGTIHCHTACPLEVIPDRPEGVVTSAEGSSGRKVRSKVIRPIKSYAPGVEHMVIDIVLD
jgi:tRNA wybutosine-synthesizing protein 2